MLEIVKYGTNKYGVWIIGHLTYDCLEFIDIFSTNIKDESVLKDKTQLKPKKFKISRYKGKLSYYLEF